MKDFKEHIMLKEKKILLGITGGIAAYKAVDLASRLTKSGAIVKTIMTNNACEFVKPITFKSITHQPVITKMFNEEADIEHISLADWADLLVIAPATANIIGKVASGIADDLLSTTIMAITSPVFFIPAMNINMFNNSIVQKNITKLTDLGYLFMEPEIGMLACGYEGKGRYPDNKEIFYYISAYISYKQDLVGKNILVTAGANQEKIDPMRFITNYSSGKMGLAIARAAHIRGANVKLVYAGVSDKVPEYLDSIEAYSAEEMHQVVSKEYEAADITIMTAAVADYTPKTYSKQKIKKTDNFKLELNRTNDILKELGDNRTNGQILVGFAAESNDIVENAIVKLNEKNLDFICANDLKVSGKDETCITVISKDSQKKYDGEKFEVAHKILDTIIKKAE